VSAPRKLGRWAGLRLARRLGKSVPFVGAVVSVAFVAEAVRRKGWLGGIVDTGLNAIPFVGALKNGLEVLSRDLIPDRPERAPRTVSRSRS
jgi:hypothetical protein